MSISFNEDALRPIVSAAIMSQIGADQRDVIIEQAVKSLITSPRDAYGRTSETPLQQAFNAGVSRVAYQVVDEVLTGNPDFMAKVRTMLSSQLKSAMAENYDLREAVVNALASTLIRKYDR